MTIKEAFEALKQKEGDMTRLELLRKVIKAGQEIVKARDGGSKSRWTISLSWLALALRGKMHPEPDPVAKAALLNVLGVKEEELT